MDQRLEPLPSNGFVADPSQNLSLIQDKWISDKSEVDQRLEPLQNKDCLSLIQNDSGTDPSTIVLVQLLGDETLQAIARELVQTIRRNVTIYWTVKESVWEKLRTTVERLLQKYHILQPRRLVIAIAFMTVHYLTYKHSEIEIVGYIACCKFGIGNIVNNTSPLPSVSTIDRQYLL